MTTYLYRFFDADGRLLYVGITYRMPDRMSSHRRTKPWDEVKSITVERYPDRASAAAAEVKAIREEKPLWNVVHAGPNRPELGTVEPPSQAGDGLVGHFFHTFSTRDDGCVTVEYQGQIVAQVALGVYLVEMYDWSSGHASTRRLETLEEMLGWAFYDSDEWMRDQYEHVLRRYSEAHARHEEGGL